MSRRKYTNRNEKLCFMKYFSSRRFDIAKVLPENLDKIKFVIACRTIFKVVKLGQICTNYIELKYRYRSITTVFSPLFRLLINDIHIQSVYD